MIMCDIYYVNLLIFIFICIYLWKEILFGFYSCFYTILDPYGNANLPDNHSPSHHPIIHPSNLSLSRPSPSLPSRHFFPTQKLME